jgi:hypothetical protein
MIDPIGARDALARRRIPQAAVAMLSGSQLSEVCRFLKDPMLVSENRRPRIEAAIGDLVAMIDALEAALPAVFVLRPDWRDAESLRALIRYCRDADYRQEIDSASAGLALRNVGAITPGASPA